MGRIGWSFLGLLMVLAVGLAVWGGYPYWHAQAEQESPFPKELGPVGVTALGRLEPKDGVIRIAGPSHPTVVIGKLLIEEGDRVETGQILASLDSLASHEAEVVRLGAELRNAEKELERNTKLYHDGVVSDSLRDDLQTKVAVLKANLQRAKAELDLDSVRAPITGQVLEIHTRAGERVGPDGIAELGRTDEMYAVAEVYETDIGRVRIGQRATITSPALGSEVHGTVERIGLKIGKNDVLSTDPAARTDARVIEVHIRLDDATEVAGLTNLQVDVLIEP